jgi:hypothetical protein
VAVAPGERASGVAAAMVSAWQEAGVRAESFVAARPAGGYEIA